jgi:4-amino-4-deoxy-L-arabinose transferase-like glycosyltransferase
MNPRRFHLGLLVITAVGLAVRLVYVLAVKGHEAPQGDAITFFLQGHFLANGHGFVNAPLLAFRHVSQPAADHPPLFSSYLALLDLLGIRTFLGARLGVAVLGTGTIAVVGLVGRRVAGPRAGLIAAGIAAVSPLVWVNDGQILSESMTMLVIAGAILLAYRFWDRRDGLAAVLFGAACGVAALVRSELILFAPMVAIPLVVGMRSLATRRRVELLLVAGIAGAVVFAPWAIRNSVAFEHPVPFGTGSDITLENTNCRSTYYGPLLGWWDQACASNPSLTRDQSEQGPDQRRHALDFVDSHITRVPVVLAARIGRLWGLFRPIQTVDLMRDEGRERAVGIAGLVALYVTTAAGIVGAVILRRRRVPISPLVVPVIVATVSAMLAFGNPRYRAEADIALVVLAAVAVDAWLARRKGESAEAPEVEAAATAGHDHYVQEGLH